MSAPFPIEAGWSIDTDIRMVLVGAAKPGSQESLFGFHDGRGMAGGEGGFLVNEFRSKNFGYDFFGRWLHAKRGEYKSENHRDG